MEKINNLIFGYRKLKISPEDLSLATSLLLRAGVSSKINNDGTISVKERDFAKIRNLFRGRIEFDCSRPLGLYGKWITLEHKVALCFSIIVSVLVVIVLSSVVWDVRIEGNTSIPDSDVVSVLSQCGLEVGNLWNKTDTAEVENRFLKSNENISWININRRGTVAYVTVIEKENEDNVDKSESVCVYSNIVASTDCVIEEITVRSGIAVVKPGDTVKKGEVLIIGVLPEEAGGGFCRADGAVVGRVNEQLKVYVSREYEKNISNGRKLYSITLNFFKFSINIFKLYGNLTNECDIIENEVAYAIPGGHSLPFSATFTYLPEYYVEKGTYSDSELCAIAGSRMSIDISLRLSDADLLSICTDGKLNEDGYTMLSDIVFLTSVGSESGFNIE